MATRTQEKEEIGFKIKLKRIRKRMKQLELAKRAEINSNRLSLIENGWTMPTQEELQQINRVLEAA